MSIVNKPHIIRCAEREIYFGLLLQGQPHMPRLVTTVNSDSYLLYIHYFMYTVIYIYAILYILSCTKCIYILCYTLYYIHVVHYLLYYHILYMYVYRFIQYFVTDEDYWLVFRDEGVSLQQVGSVYMIHMYTVYIVIVRVNAYCLYTS